MNYANRTKQNTIYWQLFFAIIISICCLYEIWATSSAIPNGQIWLDEIFHFLYNYPFISKITISILLLLNVVFLLLLLRRLLLIEHRNYYLALIYLLFLFVFPQTMNIWSMLVGFIIIAGMFPQVFNIDEENIHSKTFAYGLCCGVLAVIDFYFIFLLIFIYLICLLHRTYTFRSFILPIIGASIAFIYLFSILYLADNYDVMHRLIDLVKDKFVFVPIVKRPIESSSYSLVCVCIVGIVSIISFFRILTKAGKVVISKRSKYYTFLFFVFAFTVLLFFFRSSIFLVMQGLLMLCAMIICLAMSHGKRNLFYKIVLFCLFIFSFLHVIFF